MFEKQEKSKVDGLELRKKQLGEEKLDKKQEQVK